MIRLRKYLCKTMLPCLIGNKNLFGVGNASLLPLSVSALPTKSSWVFTYPGSPSPCDIFHCSIHIHICLSCSCSLVVILRFLSKATCLLTLLFTFSLLIAMFSLSLDSVMVIALCVYFFGLKNHPIKIEWG